jgi:hypothetical protein
MFQWSLIHGRWLQHDLWVVSHDSHDLTSYGLFHMMAPFIVEQDFLEYFHSLSTVFDSWRYVQSIQNNYLYLCHLNIFPCKQALHR